MRTSLQSILWLKQVFTGYSTEEVKKGSLSELLEVSMSDRWGQSRHSVLESLRFQTKWSMSNLLVKIQMTFTNGFISLFLAYEIDHVSHRCFSISNFFMSQGKMYKHINYKYICCRVYLFIYFLPQVKSRTKVSRKRMYSHRH